MVGVAEATYQVFGRYPSIRPPLRATNTPDHGGLEYVVERSSGSGRLKPLLILPRRNADPRNECTTHRFAAAIPRGHRRFGHAVFGMQFVPCQFDRRIRVRVRSARDRRLPFPPIGNREIGEPLTIRIVRNSADGDITLRVEVRGQGCPGDRHEADLLPRNVREWPPSGKGKNHRRAPDLVDRDFTAAEPNRKWVTDFTYVPTWMGFVYVAFVIDCFSRTIVGWHAATIKDTAMVTTALKMALWRRDHDGHTVAEGLIHHGDAGPPRADSTGRRNNSAVRSCDGCADTAGVGSGGSTEDAVAWAAECSETRRAATLLGRNCPWAVE
jgi:transposase InsO family protein